jgi:hypothetical protein
VSLYQESPTIAAIDDISAALSAMRESVLILTLRWRGEFSVEDLDELQRILDACDRIQQYHLIVRAQSAEAYLSEQGR